MRRTPRTIPALRTAVITVAATAAMVFGVSAAAHAAWNDSAPLGTGPVTTGSLSIDTPAVTGGSWTEDGDPFDPAVDRLTPGSSVVHTTAGVPITALGNNLKAGFSVRGYRLPAAVEDHVTVTLASDPATVAGATAGTGARTVTLTLTVTADAGLPTGQETIDLSSLLVTLENSYVGWTDTADLNAGVLTTGSAGGTGLRLDFNLALDDDGVVGFYLTDPAPGTTIRWGVWDGDVERQTVARDGLNQMDFGNLKTTPNIEIDGAFRGLGSRDQTTSLLGALTHVDGWDDGYGSTSARFAFKNAVHLQYVSGLPDTLTDTAYAFQDAGSANAPGGSFQIDGWDSSRVTTMAHMFDGATNYNQYEPTWDTSNVRDMSFMFAGATSFTGPTRFSSTARVTTMEGMFQGATSYAGAGWEPGSHIEEWDVSNVENMSAMFEGATAFNRSLALWDTANVTDMSRMFMDADAFNQDLGGWDTSNVTDMSFMFAETASFRGDVRQWDLASVTTMAHMFENSHFDYYSLGVAGDDPHWDVSNVQDMSFMFAGSRYDKSLAGWDTSRVTTMSSMFAGATEFNQDVSSWSLNAAVVHDDFNTGANAAWVANPDWQPKWPGTRTAKVPAPRKTTEPTPETPSSRPTATPDPTPSTSPSDETTEPASEDDDTTTTTDAGTEATTDGEDPAPSPAPSSSATPTPSETAREEGTDR